MGIETRQELIKAYIGFFKKKKHKEIPSASLIPENDPTVLFTTAGMHPLVPYLLGQKHPLGNRLVDVQKCVRTDDIDEVGDETHHTFLEMLGNWSLGDYFKKEAIGFSFEFLINVLGFKKDKLGVSVFGGDSKVPEIPRDDETAEIWKSLGIEEDRIAFLQGGVLESKNNWWGPAGLTGPCGPCTEMFYWNGREEAPRKFDAEDKRWVEIGNDVLMQYEKTKEGKFALLKKKNIDFGGGVERILAVLNGLEDNYESSIFKPIIKEIEKLSGKKYKESKREMKIVADHVRTSVFILGDERGIKASNIGQGYVLRRLIRRAIRYGKLLGLENNFIVKIAEAVLPIYSDYKELGRNKKFIFKELEEEENRFRETLENGLKKFNEVCRDKVISGKEAFLLFQSYGLPIEMTEELALEKGVKIDLEEYNEEFRRHQDLSRTASAGVFKSGLADDSESARKLHTATHLLNEALRRVLGKEVKQKGSNITPERLRFDFNFHRKLTEEEIKKVEDLVNAEVRRGLEIKREELPVSKALKSGAQAEFGAKYPELVSVYSVLDEREKEGWFSKEICTGPHVSNTREIGKFRILKEESVALGIRRIKGVVE